MKMKMKMNEWEQKWFDDCVTNGIFYIYYQRSSQSGMTRYYKIFLVYNGQLNDITFFINQHFYNSDKREIKVSGYGFSGEDYISRKIQDDYGQAIKWYTL